MKGVITENRVLMAVFAVLVAMAGQTYARAACAAACGAAGEDEAVVIGRRERHFQLAPLKDPNLATILSIGTPGLGQFYVGEWQHGLAFLGGVVGSLVAVGLAADNLTLNVSDYDQPEHGGNGDGVVNVDEYTRWEDNPRRTFGDLSTARKAIIIGGFGTALGLYVWNIIDAHSSATDYNRRMYAELMGIQLSLGVDPYGRAGGGIRFAF